MNPLATDVKVVLPDGSTRPLLRYLLAVAAYLLVGAALGAYALQLVRERRRLERACGELARNRG